MPRAVVPRAAAALLALGLVAFAGQASYCSTSLNVHVVTSGDTLWGIATAHHLTVRQLAAANGLSAGGVLRIGTHLVIPGGTSSGSTGSSVATSTRSATSSSSTSSRSFCATFAASSGASGVLPSALAGNPGRLAMRPLFVRWAQTYGVSPALVEAIAWQESGWQEGVVSSASAVGVGQLLPSTSRFVSHDLLGTSLDINSANNNIQMSARYLAYLQDHEGSTCATIAGYYEGLQNMQTRGVLPETEPYVVSVEALLPRFS